MSNDKDMLGEETLNEQEAAKEVNGVAAAGAVKASIDASAKKKQPPRKGDKLGAKDEPGVLAGAGNGSDTPGQTAKLENFDDMTDEEIEQFIESLSEEELAALEAQLDEELDQLAESSPKNHAWTGNGKSAGKSKAEIRRSNEVSQEMQRDRLKAYGEDVDFSEDIDALCESEATLSESFKEKAALIFESAFEAKVSAEVARLEEQYEEAMVEEVASIQEQLVDQVDAYMNYVVESWMKENELAIESGLRADIAESFMKGLQSVFTEHYVEVPESKVDLVDELAERVQELEEALSSSIEDNVALTEAVVSSTRANIINEQSVNLSQVQAEKLKQLAEAVEFVSVEDFANKVGTLSESYFGAEKVIAEEVVAADSDEQLNENVSERMSHYLSALRRSQ